MFYQQHTGRSPVEFGGTTIYPHQPGATPTEKRQAKRLSITPVDAPQLVHEPSARALSISPVTGVQVVIALGLAWFVFFRDSSSSGSVAGSGSARRVEDQGIFDNAVKESKTKQFEEAAPGYIARFAPIAIQEMEQFGIPASISLAQGLLESRAGTSRMATAINNHFGMKCFSKKCGKGHCANFTDNTHKDFFRKFKSPWESWRAHSNMLAQGRYKQLLGRDWKGWARGLQEVGYATDKGYTEALINIIETYKLDKYDK